LYTKGLSLSIASHIIITDEVVQNFQTAISLIDTTNETQASIEIREQVALTILDEKFVKTGKINYFLPLTQVAYIMYQISPIMSNLKNYFTQACIEFIDTRKTIKNVLYAGFLAIFFMLFAIWISIAMRLKKKTMKLRKMVNIIPLQIILSNENLKDIFLSQKIQSALR